MTKKCKIHDGLNHCLWLTEVKVVPVGKMGSYIFLLYSGFSAVS
jgi:hypothetical protein